MYKCSRCDSGTTYYEEDYRTVSDTCYHCCGIGYVDEYTHYHDQLVSVAHSIAMIEESDYRKAVNSDPDGEGYDFMAAENMMTTYDYFSCRVYDRADSILKDLINKPSEEKDLLIKWNCA